MLQDRSPRQGGYRTLSIKVAGGCDVYIYASYMRRFTIVESVALPRWREAS